MILKQLIKYDNAHAIEATWVDENDVVIKCHAYSNHPEQIAMLRADLGADAAEHEAMIAGVEATYVPPDLPPADELAGELRTALAAEYERRMQIIASGYPPSERESWPVQTAEARALLADPGAATPWIDAAAAVRGIDRDELAARIAAKDDAYRVIHGALTGARQRIEDAIDTAGDDAEALAAIDVEAGWSEELP
ncbi:hypothetical protein [Acidovorax sp. MR-S7]|uniref:hypothetical protein n=1 Tax=Acidovorax sp. MR-S7 TaxID=1268622 RepID=UPI00039A8076|nr:hypothetical protein [Acidovorax sp. MR-S7]GAD20973.1 hypothetical protein AVS7_00734 [Acidovorax sp. MR-S7]